MFFLDPAADTPISLSSQYIGTPLEQLDKPTGVLRVWYLVLDGLAMTANSCPKTFQPQTLEVLFDLLRSAAKLPGKFAAKLPGKFAAKLFGIYF